MYPSKYLKTINNCVLDLCLLYSLLICAGPSEIFTRFLIKDGMTALCHTVKHSKITIAERLVDLGAKPNVVTQVDG